LVIAPSLCVGGSSFGTLLEYAECSATRAQSWLYVAGGHALVQIGLLRRFFPKKTRFTQLSRCEIKQVQALFNDWPRKVLNWQSTAHAFTQRLR
jgi:hypothetical protein